MTMTPLIGSPEAQPNADLIDGTDTSEPLPSTEALARPFRLALAGLGAALGLFSRLTAANGVGELNSRPLMLAAAVASALVGFGLLSIAAERDRFGPHLGWIAAVTAASWGALNWVSPPFDESVVAWSNSEQAVLALVGVGNGLLLAGLISLAFVRRWPTLTVAATMLCGVTALAANSLLLRQEWPAIIVLGLSFTFILLAWDRSPRREQTFVPPAESPRTSRAALSFVSVALCGTALQLWISRGDIPRAIPAVVLCGVLIIAAFASMIRVRREIEDRETTLSEWTSWMREIRHNDFRTEIENFNSSSPHKPGVDSIEAEAPRRLSFPNLAIPDTAIPDTAIPDTTIADTAIYEAATYDPGAPDPVTPDRVTPENSMSHGAGSDLEVPGEALLLQGDAHRPADDTLPSVSDPAAPAAMIPAASVGGAFSNRVATDATSSTYSPLTKSPGVAITGLASLADWLTSAAASVRVTPLLVAVEALTLDEFESLSPQDAAMARDEIGRFLGDAMPTADLVAWIDGPYFIVAFASKPDEELIALNKAVLKALRPTNGVLALLRPGPEPELDSIVDEAVMGLLQARRMQPSGSF